MMTEQELSNLLREARRPSIPSIVQELIRLSQTLEESRGARVPPCCEFQERRRSRSTLVAIWKSFDCLGSRRSRRGDGCEKTFLQDCQIGCQRAGEATYGEAEETRNGVTIVP